MELFNVTFATRREREADCYLRFEFWGEKSERGVGFVGNGSFPMRSKKLQNKSCMSSE